jgi:hypothetical protein
MSQLDNNGEHVKASGASLMNISKTLYVTKRNTWRARPENKAAPLRDKTEVVDRPAAIYVKLNFRDRSFQVAKTYQLTSKATISDIAPSHPTRLGKNTAVPSFWRSWVGARMRRE